MTKRETGGFYAGGLTILTVFSVLCLTVFSILSLVSARADYRLTEKNKEQAQAYYAADGKAEEALAGLSRDLQELSRQAAGEAAFWEAAAALEPPPDDNGSISFQVPLNDVQSLLVRIEIKYAAGGNGGPQLTRREWKVISTAEYELDYSLPVWQGE